ncbi:MAG TPA: hypothetical protein VH817_20105 [Thermoleophilaceae bacterium]
MAAAVAVYAGVAVGHDGGGNSGSGNHNGKNEDNHHHGQKGEHHGGRHRGNAVLEASLAPSQTTDPPFHGVNPGGAPWVLDRGKVEIKAKGRLELRVRGLVIPNPPGDNTPGPVTTISASLFCGADTETAPADTSDQVPIDQDGDARIRDKSFTVPATCLAPIVLVHPNGDLTHYIAVSGWRTS